MWYDKKEQFKNDNFLENEALKHSSPEDFLDALKNQGKMMYHGSGSNFDNFSYDYLGKNGTSRGKGFYFTNNIDIARGYADKGEKAIHEGFIDIKKPLSPTKVTINVNQLSKLIKALDPTGNDLLSNYGDVQTDGYNNVLRIALDNLISTSENDVDLISDIINSSGGNPRYIYPILKKILGFDGIIVKKPEQILNVAFDNEQIYKPERLIELWNKLHNK